MIKTPHKSNSKKLVKRGGITSIVIGAIAILACELPIILALIGLGGYSASAMIFRPTPIVQIVGILLFVVGVGALITHRHMRNKQTKKER